MPQRKTLKTLIPDAATLVAMHPAELGGRILEVLVALNPSDKGLMHSGNFCGDAASMYSENVREQGPHAGVAQACAEAWQWLETNQLVCPKPGGGDGWHLITRKGEQFQSASEVREYVEAQELPVHFLNKAFIRDVRSLFLQARYDTAVFEGFRLLEVAIRERARLGNEHIGTKLASRAFHPDTGELTDLTAESGERTALMHLFVGALGTYKNSQSHRTVGLDAPEAREAIILASHLLNIVESRSPNATALPMGLREN